MTRPFPGEEAVSFSEYLRVDGWDSGHTSVQNLLDHLARKSKSEGTREVYLRHLHRFCLATGKTPSALVRVKRDTAEQLVQKYADSFSNRSRAYSNTAICSLKTFFAVNGYKRNRALDLETYYNPPRHRVTSEYIPSKVEVYWMVDSGCSLRDRAILLMLYGTGLRNSTLRSLRYKDIGAELERNLDVIMIPVYPSMKDVDPAACKGNVPYYTFLFREATQTLRLYLKDRRRRYGVFAEDDPVFCTNYNQISKAERGSTPITARELQVIVKDAAQRGGIAQWALVHPHALRKTYEGVLRGQMIDGSLLDVKTQEFLMGHILPGQQDNYYDRTKIESMRVIYSNLKFERTIVENKHNMIRAAVARAFEGSDVDPDQAIVEYAEAVRKKRKTA